MWQDLKEIVEKVYESFHLGKDISAVVNKIPLEYRWKVFDEIAKMPTPETCTSSWMNDFLLKLALSTGDSMRIYQAYVNHGIFNHNRGSLESSSKYMSESIIDLTNAIGLLPQFGIDINSGIPLKLPYALSFIFLSKSELLAGNLEAMAGRFDKSQRHYLAARDSLLKLIPESTPTRVKESESSYFEQMGEIYSSINDPSEIKKGIDCYDLLLSSPELKSPSKKSADINTSKAFACQKIGEFSDAESSFKKAIEIYDTIVDRENRAYNYLFLASLYANHMNRFSDALIYGKMAADTTYDPELKRKALEITSSANLATGQYQKDLDNHKNAAKYYSIHKMPIEEASSLTQSAYALSLMGQHEEAIADLEKALSIYSQHGESFQMIGVLDQMATEKMNIGDYQGGLIDINRSIEMSNDLKNPSSAAKSLDIKGNILLHGLHSVKDAEVSYQNAKGRYAASEGHKEISRSIIRETLNIARANLDKGNINGFQSCIDSILNEIELREQSSHDNSMTDLRASALVLLGESLLDRGMHNDARNRLIEAQQIYCTLGMKHNEAYVHGVLSRLMSEAGRHEEALKEIENAREIFQSIESRDDIIMSINAKAQIFFSMGRLEESKKLLQEALRESSLKRCNPGLLAMAHYGIAAVLMRMGDEDSALSELLSAVDLLNSIRSHLSSGDLRMSFQKRQEHMQSAIVRIYYSKGLYEKALEFIESIKSRVLLEQIRTSRLSKPDEIDAEVIEREKELLVQLNACIKRGIVSTDKVLEDAFRLDMELRALWDKMQEDLPESLKVKEYVSLRRGDFLGYNQIRDLLSGKKKSAIIEYFPLSDRLLIFVVSSEAERIEVYSSEVNKEVLRELCNEFSIAMDETIIKVNEGNYPDSNSNNLNSLLDRLGSHLVEPIADIAKGFDHLYLIPYSFLNSIPIHALPLGNKPMIECLSVSYSPSASILRYSLMRGEDESGKCLVFRSHTKDLVFSIAESEEISKLVGYQPVTGCENDAKKAFLKALLGKDIIHLSCHALFDAESALESRVKLNDSETVSAREFLMLNISAKLFSLSACESARSKEAPGDEMIGLVRAILFAGANSMLVSLWRIDDLATYLLITEFYQNLSVRNMSIQDSLRYAQIYLRNLTVSSLPNILQRIYNAGIEIPNEYQFLKRLAPNKRIFDHIFYWSPFIIIGDGTGRPGVLLQRNAKISREMSRKS